MFRKINARDQLQIMSCRIKKQFFENITSTRHKSCVIGRMFYKRKKNAGMSFARKKSNLFHKETVQRYEANGRNFSSLLDIKIINNTYHLCFHLF